MKKVFYYITLAVALVSFAASCEKNDPPVFDDANAFVAFDKTAMTISEAIVKPTGDIVAQTATLKVPVTLASVKGIEETVKFTVRDTVNHFHKLTDAKGKDEKANWTDMTAHAGVNFNLLTTSGTLKFDADHRTQYIEFEILYLPTYTGDLKFDIELTKPAGVKLGYNKKCTVTVSDVNHPLTAMFGTYTATSTIASYRSPFTITVKKDADDDHMVWFDNLFANPGWAGDDMMYYGNVDADMTTVTIPFGQTSEYKYSGTYAFILYGLSASDQETDTGSVTATIVKDDSGNVTQIDFGTEWGFLCQMELGYIGFAYPQIIAVKD